MCNFIIPYVTIKNQSSFIILSLSLSSFPHSLFISLSLSLSNL